MAHIVRCKSELVLFLIVVELAGEAGIFSVNIDPRIRAGSYLQSRFEWKSGVHRRDTNGDQREIHRMIVKAIRHLGGISEGYNSK